MITLLVIVAVVTVVAFVCTLADSALEALPAGRAEAMREHGVDGAQSLQRVLGDYERARGALHGLATLARIGGAVAGGAIVQAHFGEDSTLPLSAFALGFALYLLLVATVAPRTLGTLHAERVCLALLPFVQLVTAVLGPLAAAVVGIQRAIASRVTRTAPGPTEEEILELARQGAESGTLSREEATWATNALLLDGVTARELMTPRTVVYLLPEKMPLSMVKAHSTHWTHSRLPVCADDDPDRILGVIYRRDVFDALVQRPREELERLRLGDLKRPVHFVPEGTPGNELLRRMLREREQFYVVTNEHGAMEGIITLEDVLEFLLGEEIVDPHDLHEDMQEYARRMAAERRKRIAMRPAAEPPGSVGG